MIRKVGVTKRILREAVETRPNDRLRQQHRIAHRARKNRPDLAMVIDIIRGENEADWHRLLVNG
jgi:hypothetical protein